MDGFRARMVIEGYPLVDLDRKTNEWVWYSLAKRRRWDQLQALTGLDAAQLEAVLQLLRKQRKAVRR
jgi:hypothetical protein